MREKGDGIELNTAHPGRKVPLPGSGAGCPSLTGI